MSVLSVWKNIQCLRVYFTPATLYTLHSTLYTLHSTLYTRDARNQANRVRTNPNKSWPIWTKPNESGKTGQKRAKKEAFLGKNGA